jgi:hypothetical protein
VRVHFYLGLFSFLIFLGRVKGPGYLNLLPLLMCKDFNPPPLFPVPDLFFGITTRLILHRGFVQRLVSPYAVGLSMRNYSEIY